MVTEKTLRAPCPIKDCPRKPGRDKLMCSPHWGAVPPDLQRRVYNTYRAWLRDLRNRDLMLEYRAAATDAIEAV